MSAKIERRAFIPLLGGVAGVVARAASAASVATNEGFISRISHCGHITSSQQTGRSPRRRWH